MLISTKFSGNLKITSTIWHKKPKQHKNQGPKILMYYAENYLSFSRCCAVKPIGAVMTASWESANPPALSAVSVSTKNSIMVVYKYLLSMLEQYINIRLWPKKVFAVSLLFLNWELQKLRIAICASRHYPTWSSAHQKTSKIASFFASKSWWVSSDTHSGQYNGSQY